MSGHVREFVENYPVFQMEKSDHTLSEGKLQSTHIPEVNGVKYPLTLLLIYLCPLGTVTAC